MEEPETATLDKADAAPVHQEEEPEGPKSLPLEGTAKLGEKASVTLSGVERGTSSSWGAPADTPYVKYTVSVKNLGTKALDPADILWACTYGKQGEAAESVYDEGVGDFPEVKTLPGKSTTFTQACEMPKDETQLQIQIENPWEGDVIVFEGDVA